MKKIFVSLSIQSMAVSVAMFYYWLRLQWLDSFVFGAMIGLCAAVFIIFVIGAFTQGGLPQTNNKENHPIAN
jgi:NhaP-type Na+/H+ and K+/H+ antiporter